MRNIRSRIMILLFVIGFISIVPVSLIGINSIVKSSQKQAQNFGERSAYYNSAIIKTWLDEKSKLILNIKDEVSIMTDEEEVEAALHRYSEINEDFISLFIGFEDNEMIDAYGWKPPSDYLITERPWYIKAKNQSTATTTSVYMDQNKNEHVVAVASGVDIDGRIGVVAANIYVDYIVSIVDEIQYGDSGFALLLDENGQLITGPKSEGKINLFNQIQKQLCYDNNDYIPNGAYEVDVDHISYIASISNVEGYDWSIFLVAPIADFTKPAYAMITKFIMIIVFVILMILIVDIYMSRNISKPIEQMAEAISKLANGDFDFTVEINGGDELSTLGGELEKMRFNLKTIFESVKYESKILAMNSQSLEVHLDETYRGTRNFMLLLSHDIRTPITLIKGYAKALILGIADQKKSDEYVERITYRVDQIEKIVSDILDDTYSVNNMRVNRKTLRIKDYINMLIYNSENYVRNEKREFFVSFEGDSFSEIQGVALDIIKIQRVINNILSNAVKFSSDGTPVRLVVENCGDSVLTYFTDYGKGISEHDMDKIFNMFYKSDDETQGYGLGLYINRAIIQAHDGQIYLESEYGVSTNSGYYLDILELPKE